MVLLSVCEIAVIRRLVLVMLRYGYDQIGGFAANLSRRTFQAATASATRDTSCWASGGHTALPIPWVTSATVARSGHR